MLMAGEFYCLFKLWFPAGIIFAKYRVMKKHLLAFLLLFLLIGSAAEAQYYVVRPPRARVRVSPGYRRPPMRQAPTQQKKKQSNFEPTLNFSAGYGYPNLDKDQFADFFNRYQGTVSQTGPINAAIDYRFSKNMSIGIAGTYGKVSVPYYSFQTGSDIPDFTGTLKNYSIMLNILSYIPANNQHFEPYLRTAIGLNIWDQQYLDASGASAAVVSEPSQFAYQVALGTDIQLSKRSAFFVEAGYGKYIVNGGLKLKF